MNVFPKYLGIFLLLSLPNYAAAKYSKVANDGSALTDSATLGTASNTWGCTYDSNTQLIWEVKNANVSLRSPLSSYSWYNSDPKTNGGNVGTANGGQCSDRGNCDTEKFTQRVNKVGLCGANDWRLPTLYELKTLINSSYSPAIDSAFFPDIKTASVSLITTVPVSGFWSSTYFSPTILTPITGINATLISNPNLLSSPILTTSPNLLLKATAAPVSKAWYLSFEQATSLSDSKSIPHLVRLVRDGKKFSPLVETPPTTPTTPTTTDPTPTDTAPPSQPKEGEVWREEFTNMTTPGTSTGLSYEQTPLGQGAKFSRLAKSRVTYPFSIGLPTTGTLEFRLNIASAYSFVNRQLSINDNCAIIFQTLAPSDFIWPGSATFSACQNGDITLNIETVFGGDGTPQQLVATNTAFRFGEWHVISFSYGKNGQAISVDNQVVAENPKNTREIAAGGTTNLANATPTLGEAIPVDSNTLQYNGFEGIVDTFRASNTPKDWLLGKDYPKTTPQLAFGSFGGPNFTLKQALPVLVNDYPQQHFFTLANPEAWFTFYTKPGVRYTINIPDNSVGKSIAPSIALYDASGNLVLNGVDGITGRGQQLIFTGTGNQMLMIKITNSNPSLCPTSIQNNINPSSKKIYPKDTNCSTGDLTTTTYQLQVFLTDQPQQGIIKGFVLNECVLGGISEAEVSSLLNGIVNDSTLSFSTGQFSIPLNPDNYNLKSVATSYLDKIIGPVQVSLEEITNVQLLQRPTSSCENYQAPPLDPILQEQQAVSVYDDKTGLLIIRDVQALGQIFYAELRDIGGFRFKLERYSTISSLIHAQPAIYDDLTKLVTLPTVFAFNSTWQVHLENDLTWTFYLKDYTKLY